MRRFVLLGCVAGWLVAGGPLLAQEALRFKVGPAAGLLRFDGSSAIKDAAVAGLEAVYSLPAGFGIGFGVDVARPETDGSFFPAAALRFGEVTRTYVVNERVTLLHANAVARWRLPLRVLEPYVTGGIGLHTFFRDPQKHVSAEPVSGTHFFAGAGAAVRVGEEIWLELDVRNFVYTGYDREIFNPVEARFQNTQFPELLPKPPDPESTIQNLKIALGFSYSPRGGR